MSEWRLGGCPKCNGDVNTDPGDGTRTCLQCGWTDPIPAFVEPIVETQPHKLYVEPPVHWWGEPDNAK